MCLHSSNTLDRRFSNLFLLAARAIVRREETRGGTLYPKDGLPSRGNSPEVALYFTFHYSRVSRKGNFLKKMKRGSFSSLVSAVVKSKFFDVTRPLRVTASDVGERESTPCVYNLSAFFSRAYDDTHVVSPRLRSMRSRSRERFAWSHQPISIWSQPFSSRVLINLRGFLRISIT